MMLHDRKIRFGCTLHCDDPGFPESCHFRSQMQCHPTRRSIFHDSKHDVFNDASNDAIEAWACFPDRSTLINRCAPGCIAEQPIALVTRLGLRLCNANGLTDSCNECFGVLDQQYQVVLPGTVSFEAGDLARDTPWGGDRRVFP